MIEACDGSSRPFDWLVRPKLEFLVFGDLLKSAPLAPGVVLNNLSRLLNLGLGSIDWVSVIWGGMIACESGGPAAELLRDKFIC